jgi:hypothetical protein
VRFELKWDGFRVGAVCAAGEARQRIPIVKARPTVVVEVAADAALQAGHYPTPVAAGSAS